MTKGACLDDAAVAGARLDSDADLDALTVASFSRVVEPRPLVARHRPAALRALRWPRLAAACCQSARRRHLAAVLHQHGQPRGRCGREPADRARTRCRPVGHRPRSRPGAKRQPGETTGVEERLTDLFRHYDFSYRREFVLRGQRIQDDRIAATINGAIGGIAWGAWVPENWSQSSRNPAEEMDVALRRGLVSKAGGPLCEPAAGWIDAYLGELIDHAALLGLDQVQSLTWMYCASRGALGQQRGTTSNRPCCTRRRSSSRRSSPSHCGG